MENHDHISNQFDNDLESIRNHVLSMGGLVETNVKNAITSLLERDQALAEEVATADFKVNQMEVEIDEECTQIIARRQPAAGDLRLVLTAIKVITPAAISGIIAAYILAISRAVGETMIVAIAAGQQPNFTFNPVESAATITAYIVSVALGDLEHGGIGFQSIFAAGLTLLIMTLMFNIIGHAVRKKFAERY